jgi:hypothetical protein
MQLLDTFKQGSDLRSVEGGDEDAAPQPSLLLTFVRATAAESAHRLSCEQNLEIKKREVVKVQVMVTGF